MKQCPQCQFEDLLDTAAFCSRCGADLDRPAESHSRDFEDEAVEKAEFADDSPLAESLSGSSSSLSNPREMSTRSEVRSLDDDDSGQPEPLQAAVYGSLPADEAAVSVPAPSQPKQPDPADSQQIRKLSSQEIKEISESMYGPGHVARPYLSDEEKRSLLKSIDKTGAPIEQAAPAATPKTKETKSPTRNTAEPIRPKMADRLRGVSYYFGNIIYLSGTQRLHENDELTVGDRLYVLRKRRLSSKAKWISIGTAAAAVVLFTCLAIFSGNGTGTGTVIGVVLDETQQPYEQGAEVRFPDLGKTIHSNGQGFFVAEGIANGSHKIEYVVGDQVIGTDYATVVTGEVTTVALRPAQLAQRTTPESSITPAIATSTPTDVAQPSFAEPQSARAASPSSLNTQLALAANVDGATLRIDGQVIGAGNLTYQKIKPGKHSYTVSAEGYQTATGTIVLAASQLNRLDVTLDPLPTQQQQSPEELAYQQGEAALNSGEYSSAVSKFTDVISLAPQSLKGYIGRGEAYAKSGNTEGAIADFIQCGSLALNEGNYNQAYQAYDRACQISGKSVPALLGRATANLVRGQDLAAIADYESVLSLDRRNVQAYMGIGEARYNLGNFKEAITNFKSAKDLDPQNTEIYENLMLAYLGDNDIKSVRKTFDKYKKMVDADQLSRMARTDKYRLLMQVVASGN